jgi:hypothetical protein
MKKLLLLLCVVACGERAGQEDSARAGSDTLASHAADSAAQPSQPREVKPVDFDAQRIKVGDKVGQLTVADVQLQPAGIEPKMAGHVRFTGEVELSGSYRAHFDYPEVKVPCFWVNVQSWNKLPRAIGDSRILWFCFENEAEAIKLLGELGTQSAATIIIDNYTTHLTGSDVWNTARLVRVVSR